MYDLPPELREALSHSHTRIAKAEVLRDGAVLATLPIVGGSVTVDSAADVRRRCTFTVADPKLLPWQAEDLLFPAGNEIKLYAGVRINTPIVLPKIGGALIGWFQPNILNQASGSQIYSIPNNGSLKDKPWTTPAGRVAPRLRRAPGQAWFEFESDQSMVWDHDLSSSQCTVFVVARLRHTAGSGRVLGGYRNNWLLGWHSEAENALFANRWVYGQNTNSLPGPEPTTGRLAASTSMIAFSTIIDPGGNRAAFFRDGTELAGTYQGVGPATTTGPNGLLLNGTDTNYGSGGPNYTQTSRFDIFEVLVYNRLLTRDEHMRVGAYLSHRYHTPFIYDVNQRPADTNSFQDYFVPLGVFRIAKPKISDTGLGAYISCDGYDRARKVSRALLRGPHGVSEGTNTAVAIRDLINKQAPGFTFNFAPTSFTTPLLVFDTGEDPWKACLEMAKSAGMQLYFDADGVCVLKPEPDTSKDPTVWEYLDDELVGTMTAVTKDLDDENAYNYVVVTGRAVDETPVRAFAADNNTKSPTYVGNPLGSSRYGLVPYVYDSETITTTAQAQAVADATLRQVSGILEQVGFSAVVNPGHEAGDVVRIRRTEAGVDGLYVVQAVTVPLDSDQTMSITTRQRVT